MVSAADTNFEVDHLEPNQALEVIKENMKWPLGELAEAHEFLLLIQHKREARVVLTTLEWFPRDKKNF